MLAGALGLQIADERAQLRELGVDAAGPLFEGLAAELDLFGPELHPIVEAGACDLDGSVDGGAHREIAIGRHRRGGGPPLGQDGVDGRGDGRVEHLVGIAPDATAEPPTEGDAAGGRAQRHENEQERKSVRRHGPSMRRGCDSDGDAPGPVVLTNERKPWSPWVRGERTTTARERRVVAAGRG